MQFVEQSDESEVRVLTLARGKANAMNLGMIEEMITAIADLERDDRVRALVVASARPGFFSAGFDVEEVFGYDPPTMRHFFGRFMELYEQTLYLPKPTVGSISGHAYAGGAFLALAFDVRVMAEGEFGFALNEINFGAVLPRSLRLALINAVGSHEATRIILTGDSVKPRRAMEIGLADEVVPHEQVLASALAHAHGLAGKPSTAFRISKSALQRDAGLLVGREQEELLDAFLDQWFSLECVERRRALVVSLKAKSSSA